MNVVWRLVGVLLALSFGEAQAGVVEEVLKDKDQIIVKLTPKEAQELSEGQDVTLRIEGKGEADEVQVQGISGNKARIYVVYGIDLLKEGDRVRFQGLATAGRSPRRRDEGRREEASGPNLVVPKRTPNPPGPVDGSWRFPYRVDRRFFPDDRYAGAHAYRVRNFGGGIHVGQGDRKDVVKFDGGNKYTVDYALTSYGAFGIYNAPMGARLGLSYDKEEITAKVKLKIEGGDDDSKSKLEEQRIGLFAAYPLPSRVVLGMRLTSVEVSVKTEDDKGSESFSVAQPSIGYYEQGYEVVLLYEPTINIDEEDIGYTRPATLTLDYVRLLGARQELFFSFSHGFMSAIDVDHKNAQAMTIGGNFGTDYGWFGAFLRYRHKFYRHKEAAAPETISRYGVALTSDYEAAKGTNIGLKLEYLTGSDKGEAGDEDTKLTLQALDASLVLTRIQ